MSWYNLPHTDGTSDRTSVDRRNFLKASTTGAAMIATGLAGCSRGGSGNNGGDGGGGGENTGTGGQTGNTSKPTLKVWLSYITEGKTKKEYTLQTFKEFEQKTGVTLEVTGVPYTDVVKKFRAARASGDVPHLVEVMTRPAILAGGAGLVINDLWESSELADKATEKVMGGHKVWGAQSTGKKGNLVTVPLGLRPFLSCWRTDWLKQAGISEEEVNYKAGSLHWQNDVKPIYEKFKQTKMGQKGSHYPDTTGMKQSDEEYLSLYIPQFGGSLSGVVNVKGTKATIDTKEARSAIQFQKDWVDQGLFDKNSINNGDEDSTTMHWAGKLAVNHMQDSTDLWGDYLEEQPKAMKNGQYTWGLPMNNGQKAALTWLPSLGFIADGFSNQKEQDAAMKLLEWWIGDKQRAVQNSKNLGFVPVFPEAIKQEDFYAKTKMHEEFWRGACLKTLNEIETAVIPAVKGGQAITYDIPRKMHTNVMQEGMSVEKATKQAADEINKTLKNNQG